MTKDQIIAIILQQLHGLGSADPVILQNKDARHYGRLELSLLVEAITGEVCKPSDLSSDKVKDV